MHACVCIMCMCMSVYSAVFFFFSIFVIHDFGEHGVNLTLITYGLIKRAYFGEYSVNVISINICFRCVEHVTFSILFFDLLYFIEF